MNDDQILQRLREISWRRGLTDAEAAELRAWLAAHPGARADWETDQRLSAAMRGLKDAPVATSFTSRVLQAAASDAGRVPAWQLWWRLPAWLPRAAVAAAVFGAGVLFYHHHQLTERRAMAQSVAALSGVKGLPAMEILQDFDAIRRLGRTPAPDEELLALDLK